MLERLQQFIESQYSITLEHQAVYLQRVLGVLAGITFVLICSLIIAFDSVFTQFSSTADLEIGDVTSRNIVAPISGGSYISEVLTERARIDASNAVQPIYSPPDLETTRSWDERAEQSLDFIDDVRAASRYDTIEQQTTDLAQLEFLIFNNPEHAEEILRLDADSWSAIVTEVDNVLERVYRTSIRDDQATTYINTQLALQIGSGFDNRTSDLIFDIVDDFVKPNTFINEQATQDERDRVAAEVVPVERTFAGGQIIIGENEPIDNLAYEALVEFDLVQTNGDRGILEFIRALIASTTTLVIFGLYVVRFSPNLLYKQSKRLTIVSAIFLGNLALTQLLGVNGDIYLFPVATMALVFVAISDAHVAVITTLGLAFLVGIIADNSLEFATLIAAGGLMGTLGLRRAERLNQFFVAGVLIGLTNAAVILIFNPISSSMDSNIIVPLSFSVFSGLLLAPATALALMYVVTMLFNLPTALKLIELQQPNKPLLQRLLREAPGTYQHSLQVGNLAEQAANAIGADAQLTHVAALYHDIGKMHNPLYFTENQKDIGGNPHDTLNDPYRSADIIISHATEGDDMARQAGLPQRIRDFIREHHGTTQVYVFYQQALKAVEGNKAAVDISDFTYPGPKPQSKETAILMLADSCEAAVRSVNPQSKQEISELVGNIIDGKRKDGQLDESGLTLNDLHTIREIFVDILQGMFHPRINYRDAVAGNSNATPATPASLPTPAKTEPVVSTNGHQKEDVASKDDPIARPKTSTQATKAIEDKPITQKRPKIKTVTSTEETPIADDEPLPEVPRLPSLDERRATSSLKTSLPPQNSVDDDEETEES